MACGKEERGAAAALARPTIQEIVEKIGFGQGQLVVTLLATGPFLAEGIELMMADLLADSIAEDLHAARLSAGVVVSALLLGAAVGNVLSGPLSDLVGRQLPIILGYAIAIAFSVIGSFMNSVATISALRFLVGLGIGAGQPAGLALMNEVVPARWRFLPTAASAVLMLFGALYSVICVAIDSGLEEISILQWRLLLRVSALPVLVLGFASIFALPESPLFLAQTGDYAMARDALSRLAADDGVSVRVSFRFSEEPALSFWGQVSRLLEARGALIAADLCLCSAVLSFALYGYSYAVPQILKEVSDKVAGVPPALVLIASLFVSGTFVLLGAAGVLLEPARRRSWIFGCLFLSAFSTLFFSMSISGAAGLEWSVLASCVGMWCGPAIATLMLIQVSMEMYPTLTATSISICMVCGRLGGVVSPLVSDYVSTWHGGPRFFLFLVVLLEMAAVVFLLPVQDLLDRRAVEAAKPFEP